MHTGGQVGSLCRVMSRHLWSLPAEARPQTSLPWTLWERWFVSCMDTTRWGVKESPE